MAVLFFSGIEKAETAKTLLKVPGSAGMMSFLEYSPNLLAACDGMDLIMDSGAFSKILSLKDIERYARLIIALNGRCLYYISPDLVGNQAKSNQNYAYLLSLLPKELHGRILWVYQVSAPRRYLEEGIEQHNRIGIGGLVRLFERNRKTAEIKLFTLAQYLAARNVTPHYLGFAQLTGLRKLYQIHQGNFYCDSSTWQVGTRHNRLIRIDGIQVPLHATGFDFTPEQINEQNIRVMRSWVLPLDNSPVLEIPRQPTLL